MPRVKPIIKPDPRQTEALELIGGTLAALGITQKELASKAGMAPATLNKRLHDIGDMRLKEVWAIQDVRRQAGI